VLLNQELGLSDRTVQTLLGIFAKQPTIRAAIVYGSRAKGNYREGSDIDISLDAPDLSFDALGSILGELDDSDVPYLVDLSKLQDIKNPALIDHIRRVGKVLYKATATA
jgi:uncharacterized protein